MSKDQQYRIEKDSLGEVKVPCDRYYGAQTERSLHNFSIGSEKMPLAVIQAMVLIKKAAAATHQSLGILSKDKAGAIIQACQEILEHHFDDEFPLSVWQSGSGTQSHMNVNEVVANRANELLGGNKSDHQFVHPNDDVNKSQSTNDVFSSALQMAALKEIQQLQSTLEKLLTQLQQKQQQFADIITIGRTHMGDAVPMYLGQRFSGYADQIAECMAIIKNTYQGLAQIPIGGTAIGTALNIPDHFIEHVITLLKQDTQLPLESCRNFFSHQAALDTLVNLSASLNTLSCPLIKLANDIRLMSSGPRCGFGEINLPVNEPGSSIMPGKINPTQCEALIMVATRVQGNHVTITNANSLINFEAHSFRPVIIYSLLQSITLLSDSIISFVTHCLTGITANKAVLEAQLDRSLALAAVLNTKLGYEKACQIAKKAYQDNSSLKEAALALGFLTAAECDELLNPKNML